MKRSPLKRKTPLRAKRCPVRRPPRRLKREGSDPAYLELVRGLPCCAAALGWCRGPNVAHHPRHLAGGVGLKAPDSCAIDLCDGHHRDLHSLSGPFKGWTRDQLRDWQDVWVAATQKRLRESR